MCFPRVFTSVTLNSKPLVSTPNPWFQIQTPGLGFTLNSKPPTLKPPHIATRAGSNWSRGERPNMPHGKTVGGRKSSPGKAESIRCCSTGIYRCTLHYIFSCLWCLCLAQATLLLVLFLVGDAHNLADLLRRLVPRAGFCPGLCCCVFASQTTPYRSAVIPNDDPAARCIL